VGSGLHGEGAEERGAVVGAERCSSRTDRARRRRPCRRTRERSLSASSRAVSSTPGWCRYERSVAIRASAAGPGGLHGRLVALADVHNEFGHPRTRPWVFLQPVQPRSTTRAVCSGSAGVKPTMVDRRQGSRLKDPPHRDLDHLVLVGAHDLAVGVAEVLFRGRPCIRSSAGLTARYLRSVSRIASPKGTGRSAG